MSFFGEIAARLGKAAAGGYNIVNFDGRSVYVEGIDKLVSLGAERTEFSAFGKILAVEGEDLFIAEMERGSAIIKGRITSVSVSSPEKK